MPFIVERSQSLRNDYIRDSPTSLRPKVSFNRAVHIKRINRKERLPDVIEDEDSPDYSQRSAMSTNGGVKSPSKFSTLPSRGQRNGTKAPVPSDRLSRLIQQDPKPEDSVPPPPSSGKPPQQPQKKKTLGQRVMGIFGRKTKQQNEEEDELKARYSQFKVKTSSSEATDNETEQYPGKRRGSAPETRSSWFRSIDRLKKNEGGRKERYFGESDRDSVSPRRRANDSSAESANEGETMSRAPSLVYLHTAAVGDIPQRAVTPTRRLSRSVSVLAPWAPKTRPPRATTRSKATQTESPQLLRAPPRQQVSSRSLPKLVFTGPSIDETSGRSTTSTIQRSTVHVRSRK